MKGRDKEYRFAKHTQDLNSQKSSFKYWRNRATIVGIGRIRREMDSSVRAYAFASRWATKRLFSRWLVYVEREKDEKWGEWKKEQMRIKVREMLSGSSFLLA